jgi:hypothetical protein
LLDALSFALSPFKLDRRDFFSDEEPVVVEIEIEGVTDSVLETLGDEHRTRIEPYCANGRLHVRRCSPKPGTTASKMKLSIRTPETGEWKETPTGIGNALNTLFPTPIRIRGMEDAYADSTKTGRTTFGQLIKELIEDIDAEQRRAVEEALTVIRTAFGATSDTDPGAFGSVDADLSEAVERFIPGMGVRLHVDAPTFETFISKNATLKLVEGDGDPQDVGEFGHGTQRSTQIALIQLLASRNHSGTSVRPMLLIDEPELYLHPQAVLRVREALRSLSNDGYQVVFTTHTPQLVGREGYRWAGVVTKTKGKTWVRPSLDQALRDVLEEVHHRATVFQFRNEAEFLFSDRVVVVEGPDDRRCIEELYEVVRGRPHGYNRIGIVELTGTGEAGKTLQVLDALRVPYFAVLDLDFVFNNGRKIYNGDSQEEEHEADIEMCLATFRKLEESGAGVALSQDLGLPTKQGQVTANEAFGMMAKHENSVSAVARIHSRMRERGMWVWTCGALEQVLGGDYGPKKGGKMTYNALDAVNRLGVDNALARPDLMHQLIDLMDDETAYYTPPSPIDDPPQLLSRSLSGYSHSRRKQQHC